MKGVSFEKLKGVYNRKNSKKENQLKEPPWMNENTRQEIGKRKKTEKRNAQEHRDRLNTTYINQKKKVLVMIKEKIYKHEMKITKELKKREDKSKELWEHIHKIKSECAKPEIISVYVIQMETNLRTKKQVKK